MDPVELLERTYLVIHQLEDLNRNGRQSPLVMPDFSEATGAYKPQNLTELFESQSGCSQCPLKNDQSFYRSSGKEGALLFVVSAAPFEQSDGQLQFLPPEELDYLTKWLASIDSSLPSTSYFSTAVKCPLPASRDATADEFSACAPFLIQEIELVAPKGILILGKRLAGIVLDDPQFSSFIADRIPIFHSHTPASVLKDPNLRRPVWEELKKIRDSLSPYFST